MAPSMFFFLQFLCLALTIIGTSAQGLGTWQTVNNNVGIAAMHCAVTHWNTLICLDRTNTGPSQLTFPQGHPCRMNQADQASKNDCTAHSIAYDLASNTVRALMITTDTWCSSGQFLPNGSLLQTGGWADGSNKFRMFDSCSSSTVPPCDWYEFPNTTLQLKQPRWYASNQILPDGTMIIVGGIGQNNVEYYPPRGNAVDFPFLGDVATSQGDNLYPFVHLLPNGYLFVFANTKYVLYNYNDNTYITNNLALPGGPRNYPSAGSSAMLALEWGSSTATIVICGGAQPFAFQNSNTTLPGQKSCGRINPSDDNPVWEMDDMPEPRIMGEMVMAPTGDVFIMSGARAGSQGFGLATDPSLSPFLYQPNKPLKSRFTILTATIIPRMYHSTANLLPDGRIMCAGSNSHWAYTWTQPYPTELRVDAFSPDYLSTANSNLRPFIVNAPQTIKYGGGYSAYVKVQSSLNGAVVEVNFASAPYSTHSNSQGQRLVKALVTQVLFSNSRWQIKFKAPYRNVVPPGYYMMFVVNQGVPSFANWVQFTP